MRDETLLPKLLSGLSIDAVAELEREARNDRITDVTDADIELLLRLRDRYLRELQPHRDLLLRYLVTWAALTGMLRMRFDVEFATLMAVAATRDQINDLVAQEVRDEYAQLRK